jgi:hypothetical protein
MSEFRVGDRVPLPEGGTAQVVTYQNMGGRQILRVQDDHGVFRALVIAVTPDGCGGDLVVGPVDLDQARALAAAVVAGRNRAPVTFTTNTLAAALLLLAGDRRAA